MKNEKRLAELLANFCRELNSGGYQVFYTKPEEPPRKLLIYSGWAMSKPALHFKIFYCLKAGGIADQAIFTIVDGKVFVSGETEREGGPTWGTRLFEHDWESDESIILPLVEGKTLEFRPFKKS